MAQALEVAILFADVVGSTQLYDRFGDDKASTTVARCLRVMKDATKTNNGAVIKTIGDEVMATFPSSDDAVSAAVQMQKLVGAGDDEIQISIRVGCHFGPVVQDKNDIFGAAVHTAHRLTSQAKSKQIVVSEASVNNMSSERRAQTRQIDIATVRGRKDEVALYEVLWQPDEVTGMFPEIDWGSTTNNATRLVLSTSNQEIIVDDNFKGISIGRSDDNDLVVKGNLISRMHARVEMRRGKFILIDQSTNGTFLETAQGEQTFVRRDSAQLTGAGLLGLGSIAEKESLSTIHYRCDG